MAASAVLHVEGEAQDLPDGQELEGHLVSLEPCNDIGKVLVRTRHFAVWLPIRYESHLRKMIGERIDIIRVGKEYRFQRGEVA